MSVGRNQQLCILFAGLCCLSAERDTAPISDKKCDRPQGEGAERVKPTVCILDAEAKWIPLADAEATCLADTATVSLQKGSVTMVFLRKTVNEK